MDKDSQIELLKAKLKIAELEKKILELEHENERLRNNRTIIWPDIKPYEPYVPYEPYTPVYPWYEEPTITICDKSSSKKKMKAYL